MKKILSVVTAGIISVAAVQANAQTHDVNGTGTLRAPEGSGYTYVDSDYVYTGVGTLVGTEMTIELESELTPIAPIGSAVITSTVVFDITTGLGNTTPHTCTPAGLICSEDLLSTMETPTPVDYSASIESDDIRNITWDDINLGMLVAPGQPADSISNYAATVQPTHNVNGTGTLRAPEGSDYTYVDSDYVYTGVGTLIGNEMIIDLESELTPIAPIGSAVITSTVVFDITTGLGNTTPHTCTPAGLICSEDLLSTMGTPTPVDYSASIDYGDLLNIIWDDNHYGMLVGVDQPADSLSSYAATGPYVAPTPEPTPEPTPGGGCAYNPRGSIDMLLMLLLACGLFYGRNALARR